MAYFSHMGSVWYKLDDGSTILLNDITAHAAFIDAWKNDARVLMDYDIRDGELPHMISNRLYGTVDYWWTILLFNNIYDFESQWPRSQTALEEYIERKYPGKNLTDVHHYIDGNGLIADLIATRITTGMTVDADAIDAANLEPITIEEFEIAVNEGKRKIKLIDPDLIGAVQTEYEKLMNLEV